MRVCCFFAVAALFFVLLFAPPPLAVHSLAGLHVWVFSCRAIGAGGCFAFCCCCRGGVILLLLFGPPLAVHSLAGLPGCCCVAGAGGASSYYHPPPYPPSTTERLTSPFAAWMAWKAHVGSNGSFGSILTLTNRNHSCYAFFLCRARLAFNHIILLKAYTHSVCKRGVPALLNRASSLQTSSCQQRNSPYGPF